MSAINISPQDGPQTLFMSSPADIVFYGGAAGGGKTFALLLEPLRHITTTRGFGAVVFRRLSPQITNEGGLWDESQNIYPSLGALPRESLHDWTFPPFDNRVKFSHMQYEKDRMGWQGSQIPLIIFDELTHFTRKQFFYMMSRNRSVCGIRPYMRAAYNPVPPDDPTGGWIHEFVGWYLDSQGYPMPARSGVVRWFVVVNDTLEWSHDKQDLEARYPEHPPKSFTFVSASLFDNKILMEKDPSYLANLRALGTIDNERLEKGNHFIKPEAGKVFNKAWFKIVDAAPHSLRCVRRWDFAATEKKRSNDPDYTASCKMGTDGNGRFFILDITAEQINPADTDQMVINLAEQDGRGVAVRWEEEGGASGKRDSYRLTGMLAGYDALGVRPQGDKVARSKGTAAQAKVGNIYLLRGAWNQLFLNQMHNFPDGAHDDIPDAVNGAFDDLLESVSEYRELEEAIVELPAW